MSFKKIIKNPAVLALIGWYALMWSWVLFTDSLDLAGSKPQAMVVATIVLVINTALSVLIVVYGFKWIKKATQTRHPLVALAMSLPLFALMEFLLAWVTAIIWIGPQGSIDNLMPLTSATLLLVNTPFRYAARLVGFFGLAAFFWVIAFALWDKRLRRLFWVPLSALIIVSIVGWQLYRTPHGSTFKATIVSENLTTKVPQIKSGDSKLVIFPEYGLDDTDNSNLSKRIELNKSKPQTSFLGSQQVRNGMAVGHYNELLYGNSHQGFTFAQDKIRLIPGGEDLSYFVRTLLRATDQRGTLDYFSYAKMVVKGSHQLIPFSVDESTKIGAAVCSSIIAPKDYQLFASEGATVFSNSASLTIFRGSRIFAFEQKSLARFMAVANSRYFLQSANAASAYALDNNGKQIAEVRGIQSTQVTAHNNTDKTLFTYAGEYLVAIGLGIVLVIILQRLRARSASTKKKHKPVRKKTTKAKK